MSHYSTGASNSASTAGIAAWQCGCSLGISATLKSRNTGCFEGFEGTNPRSGHAQRGFVSLVVFVLVYGRRSTVSGREGKDVSVNGRRSTVNGREGKDVAVDGRRSMVRKTRWAGAPFDGAQDAPACVASVDGERLIVLSASRLCWRVNMARWRWMSTRRSYLITLS